ncbi:MAG TPA: RidA family protein [Cerasibacillus sp.]|uniref:RidA family protein n=1 Tax=Cerasibacillus sp. TaxID=2498711 RepID=UPI002F3EE375
MMKAIHSQDAPAAIGPYSQAIEAGDFIFVSGQLGVDPSTGEVASGIEAQTKQVLENLKSILKEANTDLSKAIKFTIYLSSMEDFATVNEIYGSYLEEPYPARVTVEVSRLPKDVLVEMDVIVYNK